MTNANITLGALQLQARYKFWTPAGNREWHTEADTNRREPTRSMKLLARELQDREYEVRYVDSRKAA